MAQPLLISFLGKNTNDPSKGYNTANYQIDQQVYTTAYFGFALAEHLKPSKILLLGTSGSMWDVLIEAHAADGKQEESRLKLMELAQNDAVDEAILREFSPLIEQHLGCPVEMKIIPYARNTDEQIAILSTIAAQVPAQQAVIMDVTHGFRHLPMLGLIAAHYLERVKQAPVQAIYYGALEMTTERNTPQARTPVLDLRGLLHTMDWIQAFAAYDASGNYASFAKLLPREGWSESACTRLREAAFFERTSNIVQAREKLISLKTALGKRDGVFLRLFGEELQKRLSWWKQPERAEWEHSLAEAYYQKGDYMRASIFTQEACLSASMPPDQQGEFNEQREQNRKDMQYQDGRFKRLSHLRNGMAHGVKGSDEASRKVLQSEQTLRATLGDFIKNWRSLGKSNNP